jgi:hypothetical protein
MITPNTLALLTSSSSLELIVIASNCCFLPLEIDDHFFTLVSIQLELVDIRPPLDISNGVLDKGFAIPWNNFSQRGVIYILPSMRFRWIEVIDH